MRRSFIYARRESGRSMKGLILNKLRARVKTRALFVYVKVENKSHFSLK
jgi:hypothetical protein